MLDVHYTQPIDSLKILLKICFAVLFDSNFTITFYVLYFLWSVGKSLYFSARVYKSAQFIQRIALMKFDTLNLRFNERK